MKPFARKLATAGSALALAASSLLLASSPASAATSCYASSCQGLDPASTICQNDARTVGISGWSNLELRYSPTCRAAWARLADGGPYGQYVTVSREDGNGAYSTHYYGNGATVWTAMVNDKDIKSHACEYRDDGSGYFNCTTSY
ncbi:hypothetical protein GCM10010275_04000 [Streptomyces litmocidini]|uniref:DUF2690 domain-containing protein n=1 Tax=Streptomyces litmocidini TaxID=67318 RepID=UPI00167E6084|nr:DUF2690 domain-containing protein [Streptomyces litmocidini]GGU72644.1 hypothetical protein GCM10010275_04000 [Streptomyces litmocidini]